MWKWPVSVNMWFLYESLHCWIVGSASVLMTSNKGISLLQKNRTSFHFPASFFKSLLFVIVFLWCSPLYFLSTEEVWLDGMSYLLSAHWIPLLPHFTSLHFTRHRSEFRAGPLQWMLLRVKRTDFLSTFKRDLREISQRSWLEKQIQHLFCKSHVFQANSQKDWFK